MSKEIAQALVICAVFASYVLGGGLSIPAEDFNAVWMAGRAFSEAQFDQIYPVTNGVFALQSPPEWNAQLARDGAEGAIYPFIYPPLWAWIAQALPTITTRDTASAAFFVINTLAIICMVWLAWRMTGRRMSLPLYLGIALAIFAFTSIGRVALGNNQPQILLSLCVVAALERLTAGRSFAAGGLMALAASMKGLPLLYAVLWIAQRRWQAVVSFTVIGVLLGLLSVLVAGWPLHREFLSVLSDIRGTLLLSLQNVSLDAMIGVLFFEENAVVTQLEFVGKEPLEAHFAVPKPPEIALLGTVLMVTALSLSAWLLHKKKDPLVWPLILLMLSMVSPLAWVYHFMPTAAFLPTLIDRFGTAKGALWICAIVAPLHPATAEFLSGYEGWRHVHHIMTSGAILVMGAAFALAIRRGPAPD
ncbi:MAG: glycosyltransferase family 87 protein [Pseudomonadota bacterium]